MIAPYLPPVTFEQVLAYNPSDPSTHTKSPLVNAVAEVLCATNLRECKAIAELLQLNARVLREAMQIETGMPFKVLVANYRLARAKEYISQHPGLSQVQLAHGCGFASYHAMWRFFQIMLGQTPSGEKSQATVDACTRRRREIRNNC